MIIEFRGFKERTTAELSLSQFMTMIVKENEKQETHNFMFLVCYVDSEVIAGKLPTRFSPVDRPPEKI